MLINALINFFNWNGRICRRQFLFVFALSVITGSILMAIAGAEPTVKNIVIFFLQLLLIPSDIKRLHDIGWSGALILLSLIPFVGFILFLLMLVVGGTKGSNKYGEDPHSSK